MDYFPLFIRLRGRSVAVVGAGAIAVRKVRALSRAGARIKVIAPRVNPEIRLLSKRRTVTLIERKFEDGDVEGAALAIAATDDAEVNWRVVAACREKGVLANRADAGTGDDAGDVIFPSRVRRDAVQIAVSTSGDSPTLARLLRDYLDACTPEEYSTLARLGGKYRERARQAYPDSQARRQFWERVFLGPVASMVFDGRAEDAERKLLALLENPESAAREIGEVYLVGAGPGDPDLLTFKALKLIHRADIVVYDRLVSPEIMDLLPADAEKIYAGKERKRHAMEQESINELLVHRAREGHRVLRLKGGDPFIFGRGGEEIETLLEERVPFQIVPGITAASGCAAYAGIPLTHRDFSHTCVFATGHLRSGDVDLDWKALAQPQQTLVFYMGLQRLRHICERLIEHGLSADTPAALITHGTLREQRVMIGRLDNLAQRVAKSDVKPPTLVIVGQVVSLHDKLRWFRGA